MGKHVPPPYRIYDTTGETYRILGVRPDTGNAHVADVTAKDSAEFIVRAVNCHDELVRVCKAALNMLNGCGTGYAGINADGLYQYERDAVDEIEVALSVAIKRAEGEATP